MMRRLLRRYGWAALVCCLLQSLLLNPLFAQTDKNVSQFAIARDRVQPHVVSILVVLETYAGGEKRQSLSAGSGTIIDPRGYIATNAHVTENGVRFRVVLNDQREFRAKLIGSDEMSDLAVLQIVAPAGTRFEHTQFIDSLSSLRAGDPIVAMGAPWGLRDSLSAGVVNHTNRLLVSLFEDEADYEQNFNETQQTARYYAWIQHDAAISPGNSGGPLVDIAGRVIGVNTRGSFFGGDMAFAIPGPIAKRVVGTLIEHGYVRRSDFGFSVRSLRGTGLQTGALIASVARESAAESAGVRAGDHLLAVDQTPITLDEPESIPEFRRALAERAPGSKLRLSVRRGSHELQFVLTSKEQSPKTPRRAEIASFGISVQEITEALMLARYLESGDGVMLEGIVPGGPAASAQPPLQVGDRIFSINGEKVRHFAEFLARIPKLTDGEAAAIKLGFDRRGETMIALIKPAPKRILASANPELEKAWAGWQVQALPQPLASELGFAQPGYRITRIYPNSPAAKAKLQLGDVITAVAGIAVKPSGLKETSALDLRIRNADLEQPLRIDFQRENAAATHTEITLTLAPNAKDKAQRYWDELLSLTVRELSFFDRIERQLDDQQQGLVIERVESGGQGGLAHLRENDVLVQINQFAVNDIAGLKSALTQSQAANAEKLSFLVLRGTETRLLFVDSPWNEKP